jgi:hypothetical protein
MPSNSPTLFPLSHKMHFARVSAHASIRPQ